MESPDINTWSVELEAVLKNIRDETLTWAIPSILITGLVILGSIVYFQPLLTLQTAAGLLCIGGTAWVCRNRYYLVSAWMLVLGWLLAVDGEVLRSKSLNGSPDKVIQRAIEYKELHRRKMNLEYGKS